MPDEPLDRGARLRVAREEPVPVAVAVLREEPVRVTVLHAEEALEGPLPLDAAAQADAAARADAAASPITGATCFAPTGMRLTIPASPVSS